MYIGDAATAFNSGKETGIREICKRSPSASKPLASLYLSATVVGKLTIPRGLNDAAEDLRKATEAEQTKKNERGIVRLDDPIITPNSKKPRASSANLTKQAITNRIVSSQPTSRSTGPVSTISPSPRPSSTGTITPSIKESDFNTLRSRLIHFIAALARPKEAAISEFLGSSRASDNEADVRKVFDQIAQEIPGPKNSDPNRWTWDLKSESWLEVRPFAFPDYTADQRTQASRRARIGSGISSLHPVWEHFSTRVDSNALASVKAITAGIGGGIYSNTKGKKVAAKPSIPKSKAASGTKPKLDDDGDLKPRRVLPSTEEPKAKSKVESTMTPSSSATTQPSLKPTKRLEDENSTKLRVSSTKKEPSPMPSAPSDSSLRKRKIIDWEPEPTSDMEEGELPSKEPKKRRIIGPPSSRPETVKKTENLMIPKKAPLVEKEAPVSLSSKQNRDVQVTKASASLPRVSIAKSEKQELGIKQRKDRDLKSEKTRTRDDEQGREKGKEKVREREKERERERERERKPVERDNTREKKEKERVRARDRANEEEIIERVKSDKPLALVKHRRRPTPSFSSSEENDEESPMKRATPNSGPRALVTNTTSLIAKSSLSKLPKLVSGPAALPNDKEGLRREYGVYYAQYLLLTSKFYDQKSKIEIALALDTDNASVDEDSDIMDSKELTELCEEYHRIRNELERIRKAQGSINTNAY